MCASGTQDSSCAPTPARWLESSPLPICTHGRLPTSRPCCSSALPPSWSFLNSAVPRARLTAPACGCVGRAGVFLSGRLCLGWGLTLHVGLVGDRVYALGCCVLCAHGYSVSPSLRELGLPLCPGPLPCTPQRVVSDACISEVLPRNKETSQGGGYASDGPEQCW